MKSPVISIVLGSYNRKKFLKLTIDSIREELAGLPYEIIAVDGGSTDGALEYLCKQKDIITIAQHNHGVWNGEPIERRSWGYFMNLGFKVAQGKYLCMVSDDCLIVPGALKKGYALFEQELEKGRKVGAMAFYWRDWGKSESYYVIEAWGKLFVNHGMYLAQALKDVNYIDEQAYKFYSADADVCLKMWQQGYECIESPESFIEHYPHANVKLREKNSVQGSDDGQTLINRWQGIYCDKNNPHPICTFKKKRYSDISKIQKKFVQTERTSFDIMAFKCKQNIRPYVPSFIKKMIKFLRNGKVSCDQ